MSIDWLKIESQIRASYTLNDQQVEEALTILEYAQNTLKAPFVETIVLVSKNDKFLYYITVKGGIPGTQYLKVPTYHRLIYPTIAAIIITFSLYRIFKK